jgi:hypothetical protein
MIRADALVIVNTGDVLAFNRLLESARGRGANISLSLPPTAFLAALPAEAEAALNKSASIQVHRGPVAPEALATYGPQAEIAARAWNRVRVGATPEATPLSVPPDREGPSWRLPTDPGSSQPATPGLFGGAPLSAPASQTSSYMAGRIAVSVVFVESTLMVGNCPVTEVHTEDWTAAEQTQVMAEIAEGAAFWTSRANRPQILTFTLENRGTRGTSCEPISRSSADTSLWVADALSGLGFPTSPSATFSTARSYANSRRAALGTDWAYTVFVVDSSADPDGKFTNNQFAFAYLNGPYMVMTYDNDGWGISRMNLVFAHETGHIFGALDEYASSNCTASERWGYLDVANASCNNGGNTADFSIMGEAAEQQNPSVDVSQSAREAIGWRNPSPLSGGLAVVDVVRNAQVTLTPASPDPSSDTTPTYSATASNVPFPASGTCCTSVSIARVASAEWAVDAGAFSTDGVGPGDGTFDEESESYTFTPPAAVSGGTHTFRTRATNDFGHVSTAATDSLTISGGGSTTVGGRNLRLTLQTSGAVQLAWDSGTAQTGYDLMRQGTTTIAIPLAGSATSHAETPADAFVCYQLIPRNGSTALGSSDALCALRGFAVPPGPSAITVHLNQSSTATVSWTAVVGATQYISYQPFALERSQVLAGGILTDTDATGGAPSCYAIVAQGITGNSNVVCAIPGTSTGL